MSTSRRRTRRGDFLEKYNASEAYLVRPNRARGVAGLIEGVDQNGRSVLVRTWTGDSSDEDLREIWRNELRVLHRLGGAPGAEEFIARLVDAGQDKQGFHIALTVGDRRPLAVLLGQRATGSEWLRRPSAPANRGRLWRNMQRVAQGLELLHEQGLLHCNLDAWSVLTTGSGEPDFQLTGFEWSMRLVAVPERRSNARSPSKHGRPISFLNDWADFARLCAELLGVAEKRLTDLGIPAHEVNDHLTADEAGLLRELIYPNELTQIDGEFVRRRLDAIIGQLSVAYAAENAKHHLILNLGPDSALSRAVRQASDDSIEIGDIAQQAQFVRNDLSDEPRVLAVRTPDDFRLVLRGTQLFYHIRPYAVVKDTSATWEFAACDRADLVDAWGGSVLGARELLPAVLDVMTMGEARERAGRLRGRTLSWDLVRGSLERSAPKKMSREERTYHALVLLHAVELALSSADVFPVSVVDEAEQGGERTLDVVLDNDGDRETLSQTLGLRTPTERLIELVERDSISDDEGWLLSDARGLGRRSATDVAMQFEATKSESGERRFRFRVVSELVAPPQSGLLVPGEFQGRLAQFRRRARALRTLSGHSELLRMLADPRGHLVETHEGVSEGNGVERLDEAKRKALAELVAVLPLYLVQGPPGVGKSFLVRELVRQRLAEEPASRLLLTAQSHHAVDHLAAEMQRDWASEPPLAVRCRSGEDKETYGALDVQAQTLAMINRLGESSLAKAASANLRQALQALAAPVGSARKQQGQAKHDRRSLDALIMRAANVVFATTNSGDLERLLEERAPFDWAIVEEAGKATGAELLMPLLLSHRRLMIGDHKQLPPFGSDKLQQLLSDPAKLRTSLSLALDMIERPLKEGIGEELTDLLEGDETEAEFAALCGEAQRVLFLFETIIEAEEKRLARPGAKGLPIARVLNIQHRMHPKIAELVSACFYDRAIKTAPTASAKFTNGPAPIEVMAGKALPDAPIVIVNMPYQQSQMGSRNVERYPRFTNPGEAAAVVEIIRSLKARSDSAERPSLAVLSPYGKQVDRLTNDLADDEQCQLALAGFQPVARSDQWCSTVDAFQGNEADVVVVSFVRNNHHATLRKALGFLSDPRRMNVLLSRARWRLYVVTSLEFLETVTSPLGLADLPEAAFLRRFLTTVEALKKEGHAAVVDGARLGTRK